MTVQLLWDSQTNETAIRVEDRKEEKIIQFTVIGEKALDAFNHPFRFAPE